MEYPGIDKPDTINHGPKNGFNCSGSLGFIYQAMGVHSAVVNGRKQIDHIDRAEMVSQCSAAASCTVIMLTSFSCNKDAAALHTFKYCCIAD